MAREYMISDERKAELDAMADAPPMIDVDELIKEMRPGLDGVTPGPWQVIVDEHPWVLPAKPEWNQPDEQRGHHVERRIATVAHHPQLHGPWPVVTGGIGIGVDKPVHYTMIEAADADHLARCSPENIRAILNTIARLEEENGRLRAALEPFAKAKGHFDGHVRDDDSVEVALRNIRAHHIRDAARALSTGDA